VGRKLSAAGYEVILVPSAADALIVAQRQPFHVLVLDLNLLDDPFGGIHEGFGIIDWLHHQWKEIPFRIVIHTTQGEQAQIEKAQERGVFAFCVKKRDLTNLLECVGEAVQSLPKAA
jgi:CheY-like chemotaxis protein